MVDAIETDEPNENPINVYCKYGNKVLCCERDKRMIGIFKDIENFTEGLQTLIDDMGVEEDGMNWCKNCGREIYVGDQQNHGRI